MRRIFLFLLVLLANWTEPASAATCPKLLMFDGLDVRTQVTVPMAAYWGKAVGVQGFFVDWIMSTWEDDPGSDAASKIWQRARHFQNIYDADGVTDNFIKVAIWHPHDWHNAAANASVVENFKHAAMLARFANLRGVALDLEPYAPVWGGVAGGPELTPVVEAEGRAIGQAMRRAYPAMTVVIIGDPLYWAAKRQGYHGGYGLSVPFLKGLLSAKFRLVVAATERSYQERDISQMIQRAREEFEHVMPRSLRDGRRLTIAPGIWPLGLSFKNKSARITSDEFRNELSQAYASREEYAWIYGFGSAWQSKDGRFEGPVTPHFDRYVSAIKEKEAACQK